MKQKYATRVKNQINKEENIERIDITLLNSRQMLLEIEFTIGDRKQKLNKKDTHGSSGEKRESGERERDCCNYVLCWHLSYRTKNLV